MLEVLTHGTVSADTVEGWDDVDAGPGIEKRVWLEVLPVCMVEDAVRF
jgi:hypothetical protein